MSGTEYRAFVAGASTLVAAIESGGTGKHAAKRRCERILAEHATVYRVEAWRDGSFLVHAARPVAARAA